MTTEPPRAHAFSIVAAYNLSPDGKLALERAIELALRTPGAVLHVVHAIDPHAGSPLVPRTGHPDYVYADAVQSALGELVVKMLAEGRAEHEVHVAIHARIGKPAREVLDLAREVGADVVVIGSHDHSKLERALLGSTSGTVSRDAGCTVLLVRAKTYPAVELIDVVPNEHAVHHRAPHRYTYHDTIVTRRPADWPLM